MCKISLHITQTDDGKSVIWAGGKPPYEGLADHRRWKRWSHVGVDLLEARGPYEKRWTAPITGIGMCQSVVPIAERRESAFG